MKTMEEEINWIMNKRLRMWVLICLGIATMVAVPIGEVYAAESKLGEINPWAVRVFFWSIIPFCIVPIYVFPFPRKVGFSADRIYLSYLLKSRNRVFEIRDIKQISFLEEMDRVTGFRMIFVDDKRFAAGQISPDIIDKLRETADMRKIKVTQTTYH